MPGNKILFHRPMSVKRNSRTAECPVDSQGVSAAREFRRNIECLKAEKNGIQIIRT